MITIRLCGGLGNQLFQWALGLAFESRGRNVKYDVSQLDADAGRRYLLGDFGWNLNVVRENAPVTFQEKSLLYDPEVLELKEGVLQGYWQNEKYFKEHELYIRGMLFKHTNFSPLTLATAKRIFELGDQSCFVHIRRTDNLRLTSTLYHGLTDPMSIYYENSWARIVSEVGQGVHFFIFSNDADFVNNSMQPHEGVFTVVHHNAPSFTEDAAHNLHKTDEGREVEDLWLMSLCRHAIIANSTFSWWGAWLNQHESDEERTRVVITPDPWFSSNDVSVYRQTSGRRCLPIGSCRPNQRNDSRRMKMDSPVEISKRIEECKDPEVRAKLMKILDAIIIRQYHENSERSWKGITIG